jgi:hypothetical protein
LEVKGVYQVKFAAVGTSLFALWQASGDWLVSAPLANSPEPLWMVLWGVALLGFAAAAREDKRRRLARKSETEPTAGWEAGTLDVQSSRGGAH